MFDIENMTNQNRNIYIPQVNDYILEVNMVSLTENEARVMDFLVRNFLEKYNINQLAKKLSISPGGMFKILKKLRNQNFLISKEIGNNTFFDINYDSGDALDACKFALTEKKTTNPYVRIWIKNLAPLNEKAYLAILFGSVLMKGKEAKDIDVLLVHDRKDFDEINKIINNIQKIVTKEVHAISMTKEDLIKNINKENEAIIDAIKTGIVLWGRDILLEVVKNGKTRKSV